ncbi:MAG: hypothetical protein HYS71_01375 [Candidatus Omnitrophica bacterium]|nr:hypothetical protein [Candidatus Omnitrophota bacterium]
MAAGPGSHSVRGIAPAAQRAAVRSGNFSLAPPAARGGSSAASVREAGRVSLTRSVKDEPSEQRSEAASLGRPNVRASAHPEQQPAGHPARSKFQRAAHRTARHPLPRGCSTEHNE